MDIEYLREQLEALLAAKPETGEQWAEICRVEREICDAEQNAAERAWDRHCESFYGGDGPLPLREQLIQARGLK